jgi:biopolymer transport protein ExbD
MKNTLRALILLTFSALILACSADRDNAVRLLIQEDGTVLMNGEAVGLDALPARFAALAEAGDTVWYHRAGSRTEMHPNVMEVLGMLVEANVPVRLFMDAEFEHPEDGRHGR